MIEMEIICKILNIGKNLSETWIQSFTNLVI